MILSEVCWLAARYRRRSADSVDRQERRDTYQVETLAGQSRAR